MALDLSQLNESLMNDLKITGREISEIIYKKIEVESIN